MTTTWGPIAYPTSLDTGFVTQSLVDHVDEVIANHPNSLGEAIVALETKLGIDGSPVSGLGGLSFVAKSANPGSTGVPTVWVDSSGGPNFDIKFTDELGLTTSLLGIQDDTTISWLGATSDGVATEIYVRGISPNRYVLSENQTVAFFLRAIARDNTNNKCKVWEVKAVAQRDGSNNSSLVGSETITIIAQSDTLGGGIGTDVWGISIAVNDTDETFRITVTGEAGSTIGWAILG